MKYTDDYIFNHDIDWFCIVNGDYIHVASAGGYIPDFINDKETLRDIQHQVEMLPFIYREDEIVYNEQVLINVINPNENEARNHYIESFTIMARKGFVSYDKTNINNLSDSSYHLVCRPRSNGSKLSLKKIQSVKTTIPTEEWIQQEVKRVASSFENSAGIDEHN